MKDKFINLMAFLFPLFLGLVIIDVDHLFPYRYLHSFYMVFFMIGLCAGSFMRCKK